MADFGFSFDINEVEAAPSREILPPGDYTAHIIESEMRDTKAGTGRMLALTLEVLDGPHAGRRIFDRLNIINPNPVAEQIARQTLRAICTAVGVQGASNSEALHGTPMVVTVKVRPSGPDKQGIEREAQNEVKGYKPAQRRPTPRPTPAPQRPAVPPQRPAMPPQRPAAPAGARPVTPPWMAQKAAPAPASDFPGDHVSEDEIPY